MLAISSFLLSWLAMNALHERQSRLERKVEAWAGCGKQLGAERQSRDKKTKRQKDKKTKRQKDKKTKRQSREERKVEARPGVENN